jgi:hypothetical protein
MGHTVRHNDPNLGYSEKPILIYLLSAFLFLNPIFNFVATLYRMDIAGWYRPEVFLAYGRELSASTWLLIGTTWLSACGLLFVRQFTLYFAAVAFGCLFGYNLLFEQRLVLFAALLPVYLLFTHFRRPYLNKRLRWWEQAPRFDGSGHYIKVGRTQTYLPVSNISTSGILIDTQRKMKLPRLGESFSISIDERTDLPCEVMRIQGTFLGLRFLKLSQAQKRGLKTLLARLTTPGRDLRREKQKLAA